MNSSSFVTKRFKSIFKRYIIFLAMILVTFNGMIPASLPVQAVEKTGVEDLEQPNVSKDVDGEESKEIEKGTDYHYNVNVQLPENISGYETMTISDDLDKRLAVQKTAVLINGEVDDRFKAVVDSQKVSLVFKQEQLQELADKEIKLQITTQVKEDAITGNKIYNIANIITNGNFVTETNPAVATPVDTEEKHQAKPNASKEDASKEDGEKNVESNDNPPAKKSADASVNQVQATNGITINDVDSYGVQGLTLLQFDGTNPTTTPKASVPITGISARNLNGLALSLTENAFYASTLGTGNLYKIDADGKADFITTLEGVAGNAVIYDGKYYYSYGSGGKSFLGSYDLTTGNKTSTEIKGFDNLAGDLGGDIVADGDGYLWFYRSNSVMQLDRETANILRSVSITNSDGVAIEWGIRGISFLPSGKMLLAAGDPNPKFYIIDPETKSTTYLGAMTGDLIFDLASAVTPKFEPNPPVLESNKTAKIQEKAEGNTDADHPEVGDTIRYTITTKNTIEDSLVKNLVINDTIPKGLTYVAGSLEVDGQKVSDAKDDDAGHVVEGKVTGTFGNVTDTDEHVVTFLVTVDKGQAGADIKNIATVGGDNTDVPDEPEEEVEIYPRDPKFESAKTAVNLDQDKEKFEVGDTVVYTIKARNTVSESIVKNFTITDKLMDGLEYVEGSLKTDPEVEATFENGTFTANFGEVKDTEWRTLTFHAKIQSGQSGKELKNIATVEGEDVPPTHPEVPIKVDPKDPKLESKKSAKLEEKAEGNEDAEHPEVGDTIRYTITTKNTIEDSLVENLVITDTIPKGLIYVAGSLEVDGQKVTDAEDDDAGHVVEGKVTGTFGNVTDTDEHTVTFLVTVDKGQAGADIKNIATVGGDNTDDPDEPEEEVEIYPRDPKFESAKTAVNLDQDKEKFEVGDTVVYTIKARNTVSESIIKNFTITDKLMDGLEYVEGSLKADPEVDATFENGTFTANFGEVKDTEWRTLTFHAKIQSGQSGKELKNIATVEGEDVPPTHPEVPIKVDPKDPKLESKKSAKLEEKAEGNKDADHPEVGDTIRYTITTKNTIEDSLVENLVITDTIPKGLIYVAGSLEVDGQKVTDAEDDDAGHAVDGKVTGTFGNVTDTDEHTVSFLVTVDKGQAGADIKNIATVGGDNTDDPDEPGEEVKIYPRDPKFESAKTAVNLDQDKEKFEVGDTVVYTIKARNTVSESIIKNFTITDKLMDGLEYVEGSLKADPEVDATFENGTFTANFGEVKDTEWRTLTFHAKIQSGQSGKELKNIATVEGEEVPPTHPEVPIKVDPKDPKLESKKSAKLEEKAEGNKDADHPEVGDTIRYTITTKNTIEDSLVENLVITDTIPKGLIYVAGSLEVDGQKVTDAEDDDAGHAVDGKVTGTFGNVKDTDEHTVSFLVTVDKGQAGADIKNIATVGGDNTDDPDEPGEEVKIYPRDPKFESAKTAVNLDQDKEKFEVGDTVVYTIKARNTVSESIIKNFTITDKLMDGLEYVEGSLKTDPEVDATFENGTFTANFGEVKDTEWRTLTFHAKIQSGQSGKELKNIATVEGEEVPPTHPEVPIKVDPKDPKLESDKTAVNAEEGKEKFEVGDTIVYTIQTRNTVSDSLVKNLTIEDTLPEGLEFVDGSLEVSHEGKGEVKDGKITATFGDVIDTEWRTVTFEAKIKSGQSGKKISNVANVGGDNIDEPDEPENETTVDPKDPQLESKKTAENAEKDKEKFEVGDTIVYTIQTRNTVSDSLVKNLAIEDTLPAGLEFVEGSLEVSHEGKGEFKDGKITATFGDVTDTEWRTVTFEAKIKSGQSGKEIENTAKVTGDNIDKPDEPENETTVDPKDPQLESKKTAENAEKDKEKFEVGDTIVYTIQTRNTVSDSLVKNLTIEDTLPEGLEFVDGSLEVSHEGKGEVKDGKITATFGDVTDTEWRTVTFEAKIKSGQSGKEIENTAKVTGDNIDKPDEPTEKVTIDPKNPVLKSEKSAKLEAKAEGNKDKDHPEVGDTLLYTIKTQNTIEDSLVKNLVISDDIPEGLEYVEGSLKVDGESVTDAKDNDKGHAVDGSITGQFGDIKDTNWHTVEFLVSVKSGQAGKYIQNIAVVDGDNVGEPDKPEEEVQIYPRHSVFESEKSAENAEKGKEKFEVGDTIVYTIKSRNKVSDSLVENMTISDTLPEGLEYVADSLKVSHEGKGEFKDGKITAAFGDVKDTEWRTVTFEAKIKSGQSGKAIENIATVDGDNVEEPDKPGEKVTVDPKTPKLESKKSAENAEKGKEKYEVGDTIVYTIQARNTVSDSLVKNLSITDKLPEGLEYVADSLKVSHEGTGDVKEGKITATFGDVTDTEWRTVTFEAKIKSGQSGKAIENIATVGGDNVDEPDKPGKKVTVDPKTPKLESKKSAENAEKGKEKYEVGDTIVYTIQARNTVSDSLVKNMTVADTLPEGLEYVADSLKVSHEGKGEFKDGKITATLGDVTDTEWRTVTFEAKIKFGQSGKAIENIATVGGDNVDEPDKPGEKVTVDPKDPVLTSEKSAKLEAKAEGNKDKDHAEVGDTIRYSIKARNTEENSLVTNLVISDELPKGLEYVAGSLKIDGESVTDAKDKDKGYAADGRIAGQFGDIKDIDWHTVEFLVTVKSGQAGKDIKNVAVVEGDNIDTPDKPEEVVQVYPRNSVLESEKLAANLEKDKEKFEVGDTVVYTIKARNKESDSLVENLTIADKLPAGLEYVDGSLEVSHKGSGDFKDGTITATFGDVKDTEWRTVTFKAKLQSGQFGESIKNIAEVSGDNVPDPNHPEAKIEVEPKDPEPTPEEPKDPKDPTPTPEEPKEPKDPAPTPDQNDNPGVKTPPSDTAKGDGKKLPNTATNLFNYGLIGILAILVGGLLALRRKKSNNN